MHRITLVFDFDDSKKDHDAFVVFRDKLNNPDSEMPPAPILELMTARHFSVHFANEALPVPTVINRPKSFWAAFARCRICGAPQGVACEGHKTGEAKWNPHKYRQRVKGLKGK